MPTDRFDKHAAGLMTPAEDGFSITPNDGADLSRVPRSIFVGGAGNVVLVTAKGTELTFNGLAAGSVLPVRANRVKATGTTATGLIGLD